MLGVGILNTSIGSGNLGDQIIMNAATEVVEKLLPKTQKVHFSSHDAFLYNACRLQSHVEYNFLCGTNCLSSNMLLRPGWAITAFSAFFIKPVVTLGVGWGGYQSEPDAYTRLILNKTLSKQGLLSVRDNYTKLKLESCGFTNVLNTGCPTMWGLTEEHCDSVPKFQGKEVVYTLTDYARNEELDVRTINVLINNYDAIYIWIQGTRDLAYLGDLFKNNSTIFNKIKLIPPSLSAYEKFLERNDVDYVGTRLHGGIYALQKKKRTIILAVDNRAEEMRRDFNIPVLKRVDIEGLEELIRSEWGVAISLPEKCINEFKNSIRDIKYGELEDVPYV